MDAAWVLTIAAVGVGGFGLGIGLVVGAYVARALRRYTEGEFPQNGRKPPP